MSDEDIAQILRNSKVIAIVGMSPKQDRPSWGVGRFLKSQGYRIVPVNPGHAGQTILDETVYADLSSIPADIAVDMVDIFRRPEAVPAIVDEALAHLPELETIWMQLGVTSAEGAEKARAAGLNVVQDRCPKIELPRLGLTSRVG
ncbi:CoA-binding protein [uncultured Paracoccus sp.]|uniref:CoA-binding protein n=1 Tax=uncultured Paracoccus sp. TaxID=189685 RepID=UPI0025E696C3|nr:CoA-binding protein [uncultured Paracoccus sp.]